MINNVVDQIFFLANKLTLLKVIPYTNTINQYTTLWIYNHIKVTS